jgi:hypothetical protein
MRVWFRDFSQTSSQLSLFSETAPGREKKVSVTQALDNIRGRHGDESIQYARTA